MILALDVAIVVVVVGIIGMIIGFRIDSEIRVRQSYPLCDRCGHTVRLEGIGYHDGRNYHFGCDPSQPSTA